jgi:hypothetical protein
LGAGTAAPEILFASQTGKFSKFYLFLFLFINFFIGPDGHARSVGRPNTSVQVQRRHPRRKKEGSQRGQRRRKRRKELNRVMARSGREGWMIKKKRRRRA